MYTPARAAYVHKIAVDGIITRNEDLMKDLVENMETRKDKNKTLKTNK